MEISNPATSFASYSKSIKDSVAHVLIFRERSNRLASRLREIIDKIPKIINNQDKNTLHAQACIPLLTVTVDDLVDYYEMISLKSPALTAHLLKYGSDEECFYKWNERLRLISQSLNMPEVVSIFDPKIDQQDLEEDVKRLREIIPSLSKSRRDREAIMQLLDRQKSNAYKTVHNTGKSVFIKAKSIKYDRILGTGAFGEVWRARIKSDFVAVKKIPKNLLDDESRGNLKAEAEVMRSLSHPGIVACIGVVEEGTEVCLVLELCSMGSLDNLIKTRKDLSFASRRDLALDIANAMSYLHRLNVVHRDLKPGNIVLDDNMRPKITDFGLAFTQSATMTSFRGNEMGTPAFMAPECFGLTPMFSTRSDVYAFSIILWELVHLQQAYKGVSALEIRDSIKEGQRLPIDVGVSENFKSLIRSAWDQNPRARLAFVEIVRLLKNDGAVPNTDTAAKDSYKPVSSSEKPSETKFVANGYGYNRSRARYLTRKNTVIGVIIVFVLVLVGGIVVAVMITSKSNATEVSPSDTTGTIVIVSSSKPSTDPLVNLSSSTTISTISANTTLSTRINVPVSSATSTNLVENLSTASNIVSVSSFATSSTPSVSTTVLANSASKSTPPASSSAIHTTVSFSTPVATRTSIPISTSSVVNVTTLVRDVQLQGAWGMVIDEKDDIYVATTAQQSGSIYRISPIDGAMALIYIFKNDDQGYYYADQGLCYFNGSLYLPRIGQITRIDLRNNNQISRFAGTGISNQSRIDGDRNNATFYNAVTCITDKVGNLLVSDASPVPFPAPAFIRKVFRNGSVSTIFSSNLRNIFLGFDRSENILIAGGDDIVVSKVTGYTTYEPIGTFQNPTAMLADTLGNLFITDSFGHCFYWLDSLYSRKNLAGKCLVSGYVDSNGTNAKFDSPRMIAFDSKGRLFAADQANGAIRMITWR